MDIRIMMTRFLGALLLMCGAGTASAALVNFSFDGTVGSNLSNPFGLALGDTVTASGVYDTDTAVAGAPGQIDINLSQMSNSITITAGSLVFTESDNSTGTPTLHLETSGSTFVGLSYWAATPLPGFAGTGPTTFASLDGSIAGSWNASSFQASPVPVPAAVWLFGSGLLGLVGVARRRR